jgi:hypothetical protein
MTCRANILTKSKENRAVRPGRWSEIRSVRVNLEVASVTRGKLLPLLFFYYEFSAACFRGGTF